MIQVDINTLAGRERVRHQEGVLNVSSEQVLSNVASSICRGLPQVRSHPTANGLEVCIVGSGPSLAATEHELRACIERGMHVVALNGAYGWLLEHGIKPNAMVCIDARAFNARFITEPVDRCHYFLASQCAPEIFERVRGLDRVWIWHAFTGFDPEMRNLLDSYYLGSWQPVLGGCTVGTRAIVLLRLLGYVSMHLFGMDSCYMDGEGHAMPQPENEGEGHQSIVCAGREFRCSAWHQEQALEFIDIIAAFGSHFQLEVHGRGLLAHIIESGAEDEIQQYLEANSVPVAKGD